MYLFPCELVDDCLDLSIFLREQRWCKVIIVINNRYLGIFNAF